MKKENELKRVLISWISSIRSLKIQPEIFVFEICLFTLMNSESLVYKFNDTILNNSISVTYSEDVGAVGGAMLDVLNSLTDTSLEVEVSCCRNGELSVHTCGNNDNASYVPCNNICGKTNESKQSLCDVLLGQLLFFSFCHPGH